MKLLLSFIFDHLVSLPVLSTHITGQMNLALLRNVILISLKSSNTICCKSKHRISLKVSFFACLYLLSCLLEKPLDLNANLWLSKENSQNKK